MDDFKKQSSRQGVLSKALRAEMMGVTMSYFKALSCI